MQIKCIYCGSGDVIKRGTFPKQRYQCKNKKHPADKPRYFYAESSVAKVLVFDIETLPMKVFAWRLGEENWSPDNIIQDWCVLSYSAKWLFEPEVESAVLTPKEAVNYDDKRLVEKIYKLFDEADVIIAHNGDQFDIARMNTRFLFHQLPPPKPFLTIDTRKTAKAAFGFSSNKLAYIAEYLGLPSKLHTDFELWKRCVKGEQEALDYMRKYNAQDIFTLEDVYIYLRPWIKHPNMALFMTPDNKVNKCPRCGSDKIKDYGVKVTDASVFSGFVCENCGGRARYKTRLNTTRLRNVV